MNYKDKKVVLTIMLYVCEFLIKVSVRLIEMKTFMTRYKCCTLVTCAVLPTVGNFVA